MIIVKITWGDVFTLLAIVITIFVLGYLAGSDLKVKKGNTAWSIQ